MKKIIALILTISMILSMAPAAFAIDAKGVEAEISVSTHIVNVTGQMLDIEGTSITILLVDDAKNVKHIEEAELEADGTYRAKFKYIGDDFADLTLRVKQGTEDVTETVISATAKTEPIEYKINISNAEGKTVLNSKIENYYNVPGKTYTIMTAYYGENNKLLDVFVQNTKNLAFEENEDSAEYDIPEGAEEVKVFIWNDEETMIPLRDEVAVKAKEDVRVLLIGHSFVDDSRSYLPDIAAADGVNLTVDWVTYGGGGFTQHWKIWSAQFETQEEAEAYDEANGLEIGTTPFRRRYHGQVKKDLEGNVLTDEFGENMTEFTKSVDDFFDNYDYDYVAMLTLYGIMPYDAVPEKSYTGYPNSEDDLAGQNMVKYIREHEPNAEIAIINTWAYEKESTGHIGNGQYIFGIGTTYDQDKMWEQIRKTVEYQTETYSKLTTDDGTPVSLDGKPLKYIPSGQAFNIARENILFDTKYYHGYTNQASSNFKFVDDEYPEYKTLHRDSYHCSRNYGRYLAGLVMYSAFTGNSASNNKFVNPDTKWKIPESEAQILRDAAQKAIDDSGIWN